jgi:hypothetical protein
MHASQASRASFKTHVRVHKNVLENEHWFGDSGPKLGRQFTVAKAKERKTELLKILWQAAKSARNHGNLKFATSLEILGDKLHACSAGTRCGSLACEECRPAFQRAKFSGQARLLATLKVDYPHKQVVMATIIPRRFIYRIDELDALDVAAANRWVKDVLTRAGFRRVMLGSFDLSWEDGFYQGHWHIPMLTSDLEELKRRLKAIWPVSDIVKRPVVVSCTYSNGYLPYKDKAIKIPELLRQNRRGLPNLLLALDRTEPLELMVIFRLRLSAQHGELHFKPIP